MYPLPSMVVNLPCLTGSLSQLPSFCISIIRVSAQLLHRIVSSGDYSCRLLAHSLFVLLTLLWQQHFSADVYLLPSAFALTGHFPLNLLITSLSWLESGVRGGTVPRHFVPLIADSNHDTLTMRFSCYAACSICFCGLLMSLIIFAPS